MGVRAHLRRSGNNRRATGAGRRRWDRRGRFGGRRWYSLRRRGFRGVLRRRPRDRLGRQDRRWTNPQHPAEGAQRAAERGRRGSEQFRHVGIPEQVLKLRAVADRLRHQLQQPAEILRQRVRPPRAGTRPARGGPTRHIRAGANAGDETGDALVDVAEPADDQRDQRQAEPDRAPRRHGRAEPAENGGKPLGRGGGCAGHRVS
jgi:hypothetical protein